jgi:hypothetical protein
VPGAAAPAGLGGPRRTFTATNWRPAVRLAPTAADTEDSLAHAGRSPFSPRIGAPAMTIPQSGGLLTRKGGKVVTIPLAPRTARAIDLAIGERPDGPVFLAADGRRLDRHGAGRIVRKVARRAGIVMTVTPHTLRHASG